MKKITVSQYNELFHMAENTLQNSWRQLGLTDQEIIDRSNKCSELQKPDSISPVYNLYKSNANNVVDNILKSLGIEVEN